MSAAAWTQPDVIVIGGGIQGCSTALNLAMRGVKALLIEKDHAGRHASGVNAGGVRRLGRHIAEIPLSVVSMEIWHRIEALVDDDCGFESHGQIKVAETTAELDVQRARVAQVKQLGFEHEEIIEQAELRALVPAIAPHCVGAIICRTDGAALPFRTVQAMKLKAEGLGARFIEGVCVNDVKRAGDVWRVETDSGPHEAPTIINCAGAWADRIAAKLGEPVPLEVIAPMLMITARMPRFVHPVIGAQGRTLSFKQYDNGTVLIGGGYRGRPNRDTNRTELDFAKLAENAQTAAALFPIMAQALIMRAWAGIEARMPDDIPVIGPSSTSPGVFHAFGFSAHGFQLGPAVGQVLAELVTTGRSNIPIDGLSIARFANAETN
ncbi:MAG: FAD-dependent oxidoreductase [Hyphomicrobiaceae bacterium]